jgi:putative transposase
MFVAFYFCECKLSIYALLRREVTHCEIFETVKLLIEASCRFFERLNKNPKGVLSIIGAHLS